MAPSGAPGVGWSAFGPLARPGRDLVVALVVGALLVVLVRARAGIEYPLPVSIGNATVENGAEVLADAEERLDDLASSQGGRIAEEAACYFWRPMGPTQGAASTQMLGNLLPSVMDDAVAMDIILCGPAELTSSGIMEGLSTGEPWVTGLVGYRPGSSEGAYRGEVQTLLPMPLTMLTATGGVQADTLLSADGRSPDDDAIDDPTWIEIEGTGEGGSSFPELPDLSIPDLPGGDDLPELPDLPDLSIPDLPTGP
ncbi:MAG TPA: hypothetical protein VIL36_24035 [Acidimicrobiales bacterium]